MEIVKLLIGTNTNKGSKLLNREFGEITWWSNNLETVAHYYEGSAIEITVKLNPEIQNDYIRDIGELTVPISEYTYGFIEVLYPKGATWYSFNGNYLKENIIEIKEVFPDLSEYNEE